MNSHHLSGLGGYVGGPRPMSASATRLLWLKGCGTDNQNEGGTFVVDTSTVEE